MEPNSPTLADEALEIALEAGALQRCLREWHVIVTSDDPEAKRKALSMGLEKIYKCPSFFPSPSLFLEIIDELVEMERPRCKRCPDCPANGPGQREAKPD